MTNNYDMDLTTKITRTADKSFYDDGNPISFYGSTNINSNINHSYVDKHSDVVFNFIK